MNPHLLITLIIAGAALALLLTERLRADLVALLVVVALGTTGVLTSQETFSGFSRSAVITLLAVTGLTHHEAYKDIFCITLIKTLAVFVVIGTFYATGIV